jgi:4-amino-4-deoxy-L-arabinose transferase-like glycosyltransferase
MKLGFVGKFCFLLIILIALCLRIYKVNSNPPALSWDEVSIGFNAYSILKTGFDEHHRFLPLDTFIGYGDYKPPLSIYATVPFVALFGLNELAVRLPSVIFGTLTIAVLFFLVLEVFNTAAITKIKLLSNIQFDEKNKYLLAYITIILLCFSPWHINISRAGFEANIALFWIVSGVYFILKARKIPKFWIIAWWPFALAAYTFNSARYFVPFLAIGLSIFCGSEILKHRKYFILGILTATILMLPIIPHLLSKEARLRFTEVNIFSDISVVAVSNQRIELENNSLFSKIVDNRRIGYMRSFFIHFFDNLQPEFLFIKGDGNPKFSTQDVGQMYLIEAPFLIIGFVGLFIYFPFIAIFNLYWLITAIIPAATARETPHALRILNSVPAWYIFIAFGIYLTFVYSKIYCSDKKIIKPVLKYLISGLSIFGILVYFTSIIYYVYNYHEHYPREFSNEWQYGYKQALMSVKDIEKSYDKIYVTDIIGRPYMYVLFYEQFNPASYWNSKRDYFDAAGFYHVDGFDKYVFVNSLPEKVSGKVLVIGQPHWLAQSDIVISRIKLLDGQPVLTVFEKH